MKIRPKNPNKNNSTVVLELDELYAHVGSTDAEFNFMSYVEELAKMFNARRTAYNMWEFANQSSAEQFIFVFRLKHENKNL